MTEVRKPVGDPYVRPAIYLYAEYDEIDAELARARALVDRLWDSIDPADVARLEAQARLIAAYEEGKWPRRSPSIADLIRHLMDQHGLTRADMVPILGTPSRVSEVLRGKKGLSMAMVQRLRARLRRAFEDARLLANGLGAELAAHNVIARLVGFDP